MIDADQIGRLLEVLDQARQLGFVGPGPLEPHLEHSLGFLAAVPQAPTTALDLGSGGGLPGLVLALAWPDSAWLLVDASARRAAYLTEAVDELGVENRVQVLRGRAEALAHEEPWRGSRQLVVARSFGPPAVVAECAAGFLAVGGQLVVSEPPEEPGSPPRWPKEGVQQLSQQVGPLVARNGVPGRYQVIDQVGPCPDQFPRRDGVPAKRPLF